jgi:hypothetical protein
VGDERRPDGRRQDEAHGRELTIQRGGSTTRQVLAVALFVLVAVPSPAGQTRPLRLILRRCQAGGGAKVLASIGEVGFHSAVEILATYVGRALQSLAGLGLNSMAFEKICVDLSAYRRFPEGLFTGSKAA